MLLEWESVVRTSSAENIASNGGRQQGNGGEGELHRDRMFFGVL